MQSPRQDCNGARLAAHHEIWKYYLSTSKAHAKVLENFMVWLGCAGSIVDMKELGVWEPLAVKAQTIKTAVESATLLLRIDDIVSGMSKREKPAPGQAKGPQTEDPDQVRIRPHLRQGQLHAKKDAPVLRLQACALMVDRPHMRICTVRQKN